MGYLVRCAIAAMGVAALSAGANAALLYTTGFDAPTYIDGALIGQDGWVITGTTTTNALAIANAAVNGSVTLNTSGQDANHPLGTSLNSDSVYLSADITLSAAQSAGDYFIHLGDGGNSNFYSRIYAKATSGGFVMAMGTSSGAATYGTTVLSFGTTYRILARYDFVAGAANDTGALFINPVSPFGIGDTQYVAATTVGTDPTTISSVNIRQGTASSAPTLTIDNINVSTIPAPGSVALVGLGGLALLRRRRK